MTKNEVRMTKQSARDTLLATSFVIRHSDLIRHSGFDIVIHGKRNKPIGYHNQ